MAANFEKAELTYAVVAFATVRTPGRPVELAGYAPLHPDGDAIHLDVLKERRPKVVVVFFGTSFRNDARIHKGGQKEIRDHK